MFAPKYFMTDPDDCQRQAGLLRQPILHQGIQQPNFGLNLNPEHINAPREQKYLLTGTRIVNI